MSLTEPRRRALLVLADEDPASVGGWKKRSQFRSGDRIARVNYLAAKGLVELGLASSSWGPNYTGTGHTDTYALTDAGRAEARR